MKGITTTCLSFGVMLLIWNALFHSLEFAGTFLVLLAVHEFGHYVSGRLLGIDMSTPVFTPVGAVMNMRAFPASVFDEALMAYGGPFVGTAGAIAALLLGTSLHATSMVFAAKIGLWFNLFNLIPLSPLDGGRISMAIERRAWVLGLVVLGAVFFMRNLDWFSAATLFVIAFFATHDVVLRKEQDQTMPGYFELPWVSRASITVAYLSLVVFLLFAIQLVGVPSGL